MGHFGDAVSTMDFRSTLLLPNFWSYPQWQPCSIALGKFLPLVFHGPKEKAFLAFDCKYVSWSLPLSKLWHPAPPYAFAQRQSLAPSCWNRSSHSGKQLLARDMEVQIYSYTDRQPTERKNEYTLKLAVKCDQNNYAKAEAIIAVQAQLLCKLANASCQQKETSQAIFLPRMVTVAQSSSKLPVEEKPHLPSGWQQKRLSSIHPLRSDHWSISKTHFFRIKHLRPPSPKRPVAETPWLKSPRSSLLTITTF